MSRLRFYAFRLMCLVLASYLLFCSALWFFQDTLIYEGAFSVPENVAIQRAAQEGLLPLRDSSGTLIGYEEAPQQRSSGSMASPQNGIAIVFHGKGGNALSRKFYEPLLEAKGFHVIMFEYPGYEGRTGHANEKQIVSEARALIQKLHAEGRDPIYLWGESLGTGVVGSVAADESLPIAGIVLVTPFDSLEGIAASRYPIVPVTYMIRDRYDSFTNLAHIHVPVVVVQAQNDKVVPAWSTDHLFEYLPEPKLRIVLPDCGHNNWPKAANAPWWDRAIHFITESRSPHS